MGSVLHCAAALLFTSLLSWFGGVPPVLAQDLRETDALCNEDGCFVVFFQRKTFLDAWRACKERGGNLATIKRQVEADTVAELFAGVELQRPRASRALRVWIGLQRQPRQCTASRPLRGFSWTTGDQDTEYTNWQREDSPSTCSVPRCVVMSYSADPHERPDNFKWLDGACSVPVDGYLCRYTYKGMCPALWSEGGGNALYFTPFNLLSSLLTHVPFGSRATVPCPADTKDEQSVLCVQKPDGTVGWSQDAPLCTDPPAPLNRCGQDNGGCEHFCKEDGAHSHCECSDGFQLAENGQSCEPADVCRGAPCQFECLPLSDGYRCACPEGYMLAPDERGCVDVDECLQSPCEQLCVNAPGSFECRCRDGYRLVDGECEDMDMEEDAHEDEDVDECMGDPCEHACENTPGSHICHCHLGFSPLPEDPSRCQDTDECQIPGTCEQMCVNYEGGFECYCEVGYELLSDHFSCRKIEEGGPMQVPVTPPFPWVTHHPQGPVWDPEDPVYDWTPQHTEWPPEGEDESLDWLTDPPKVPGSDVIWVTSPPQDELPVIRVAPVTPTQQAEKPDTGRQQESDWPEWGDRAQSAWAAAPTSTFTSTSTSSPPPPTTEPTPTPDYYDDEEEEEEETTTGHPALPTTTISGGAWNFMWFSPTPAGQKPRNDAARPTDSPLADTDSPPDYYEEEGEEEVDRPPPDSHPQFPVQVVEVGVEVVEDYGENTSPPDPARPSLAGPPPAATVSPERAGEGDAGLEGREQKEGGSSWLLVGLLVPLCIFVVVMVALGIVYCTRCAVQPPSDKSNASDCYHWISGAHDKQAAAGHQAGCP